ncbi:heavy metal translocating P-type ATPase [Christiangramia fulva]|uniref:Heavy metal translocating P-type ATPase n=1 Tax=Christiangramia fulva TaxID=2126553 RepID=A0A2R3Z268_9FLAO|nr:heavy metal translocating P-type ATPase metal-binding domain-containing protein [Christiangramia fulva]AVR44354.1 heavy metal translocating P-type ATPase [Christiangramia fulva]
MEKCYHCGEDCIDILEFSGRHFCCNGCKMVYEILETNDLSYYYELQERPGISQKRKKVDFSFLDNEEIVEKLLDFDEAGKQIASLHIPTIHCSSCIWILENLNRLHSGIQSSTVDFPRKKVRVSFSKEKVTLKEVVALMAGIGYEPSISLENYEKPEKQIDRSLIFKLGVAGFAFGNIMFLSFPEYFEVKEFWLDQFKYLFRWLMFAFSLPVVFYSANSYFISAYKGLRSRILNIDVPIALGIFVLFFRSFFEIITDTGTGFFDSLSGLVFFLLLGKYFQQKTYSYLSFERDYRSYFPIAVTRISKFEGKDIEEQIPVYKIEKGDRILIRNEELVPMDAVLLSGAATIDYSFVTGEAEPIDRVAGDKLFAGGRQKGGLIEVEALKPVKQSYLTELWSDEVFRKNKNKGYHSITDKISKYFTLAVIGIALIAGVFWLIADPSKAGNAFTAVLIIACPCAIALAAPFTLGNILRIFGRKGFYLKEAEVIEQLAEIDAVVFDKTGTITNTSKQEVNYAGMALNEEELQLLTGSLRASGHPLSRSLYNILKKNGIKVPEQFEEVAGQGIAIKDGARSMKIGSANFVDYKVSNLAEAEKTSVHISSDSDYKGCFTFRNSYREGTGEIFRELSKDKELYILSGDNEGERQQLEQLLPSGTQMFFDQRPGDKLEFIKNLQKKGLKVMMVGDGLNDAGALAQSNVGVAVSEDINIFSPACDAIMDVSIFRKLPELLKISKKAVGVIYISFLLSFLYNLIGLGFAVTGNLKPVYAAILMPLSSVSIVAFTTFCSYWLGKRLNFKKTES